jgi:hypothetical protein
MHQSVWRVFRPLSGLLFLALFMLAAHAAAFQAQLPAVRFLSAEQARIALTEGVEKQYFASLYLGEMRAKTGLPLTGKTLDEARELTRLHYAAEVLDFTADEKAALEGVLVRLQPNLLKRAPLYARTPWSFLKVSDKVEGALPHTRGDHIVLSTDLLQALARLHREGRLERLDAYGANLLVHEQTHVMQRRYPALFARLNTDVFGFQRLDPAPVTPYLLRNGVVNPDAPDCGWAYPARDEKGTRWVMPYLLLENKERPRMPQDFTVVGVTVEKRNGRWVVQGPEDKPEMAPLQTMEAYVRAFPDPSQAYHPNEIAADVLGGWITVGQDRHPLAAATASWAGKNLR